MKYLERKFFAHKPGDLGNCQGNFESFRSKSRNFDLQILSSSIITRILWNVLFAVELLFNGPSLATHLQDPKAHEMSKTKGNWFDFHMSLFLFRIFSIDSSIIHLSIHFIILSDRKVRSF